MYADDVSLTAHAKTFEDLEKPLKNDLDKVNTYFKRWYLTFNRMWTTVIAFRPSNKEAEKKLNFTVDGVPIHNERNSRYIGIKLDRSLNFQQHLGVRNKKKSRKTILTKPSETSCLCKASVLRPSAIALANNVTEYYAYVWTRSVF